MPRIAGATGVCMFPILKWPHEPQNQGLEKNGPHIFFCRALGAIANLCFWVARLDFAKKRVLKIDRISLKPLKNIVPNWRGRKHRVWIGGPKMGHLRSGSKRGAIYLSFHFTSFPIHLQEHRDNCLSFHFASRIHVLFLSVL